MKLKRAALGLIFGSSIILSSCVSGRELWAQRLEIEIKDDLSGQLSFILLQSNESSATSEDKPLVDAIQTDWIGPCDVFKTQPFLAYSTARGFKATVNFSTQGELIDAFTCIPILAQLIEFNPMKVNESLLGVDYELQIEIFAPDYLREVRVTLPGKIERYEPATPAGVTVVTTLETPKTVVWQISTTSQFHNTGSPTPLLLIARSHKTAIRMEWIFSILGVLFGSGIIWRVFEARKKKKE